MKKRIVYACDISKCNFYSFDRNETKRHELKHQLCEKWNQWMKDHRADLEDLNDQFDIFYELGVQLGSCKIGYRIFPEAKYGKIFLGFGLNRFDNICLMFRQDENVIYDTGLSKKHMNKTSKSSRKFKFSLNDWVIHYPDSQV